MCENKKKKKKKCLKKTEVANLQGDLGANVKIKAALIHFK